MGMFSEVHAQAHAVGEAGRLEKVLLMAIYTDEQKIISFCKEHIYPLYVGAVSEALGSYKSDNKEKINRVYQK